MTRSPGVASKIRTAARRVSLESPTFDPRPKYATTGSTEPMPFVASRPLSGGAVPQPHPPRPASGRSAAQASGPGSAPSPRESSPAPYPQPVLTQPPTARTVARGQHLRVHSKTRHVIDHERTSLQRTSGHLGFVGVHGNRDRKSSSQSLHYRQYPGELLLHGHSVRTWARRLSPYVNHMCPLLHHLPGRLHGHLRILMLSVAGEGIRGHVDSAHNQRAISQVQTWMAMGRTIL